MDIGKSVFTGIPKEYFIPPKTEVVFVADLFESDYQGGAELTSEAIIKKSPYKIFKMHSASLTEELLIANKNKYWVFGNYTQISEHLYDFIKDELPDLKYSILEYDFKFCVWRSTNLHLNKTGFPCTCETEKHGLMITDFMMGAENLFWMADTQLEFWINKIPGISRHSNNVILSSVFDDETLKFLASLRKQNSIKNGKTATLGSGSWIKGVQETGAWCHLKKKNFEQIPSLPYKEFLKKLSEYKEFVFMPLDKDTCPRVTIEAKLMGVDVIVNDNVLHGREPWFIDKSPEECTNYLKSRPKVFWDNIKLV